MSKIKLALLYGPKAYKILMLIEKLYKLELKAIKAKNNGNKQDLPEINKEAEAVIEKISDVVFESLPASLTSNVGSAEVAHFMIKINYAAHGLWEVIQATLPLTNGKAD